MPVTVINQPTSWVTWFTNKLISLVALIQRAPVRPSADPFPHDALRFKAESFESTYNVNVKRVEINDLPPDLEDAQHWLPLMIKQNNVAKPKRLIYYWHGGAFVNETNPAHWDFLGLLVNKLDADAVLQTYTMVPHAGVQQNIDKMLLVYEKIRGIAKANGQEFIIGGDSAGGTITAAVLLALNDRKLPLPDQVFMVAPGLDLNLDNPRNRSVELVDPMLNIDKLLAVVHAWGTGPIDRAQIFKPAKTPTADEMKMIQHPYASPIYGDWKFMADVNVPVTISQGTHDLLLPQVDDFVEKAKELDMELTYIRADGCCHVYPMLAGLPGASFLAPESIEGLKLLVDSIRRYSKD